MPGCLLCEGTRPKSGQLPAGMLRLHAPGSTRCSEPVLLGRLPSEGQSFERRRPLRAATCSFLCLAVPTASHRLDSWRAAALGCGSAQPARAGQAPTCPIPLSLQACHAMGQWPGPTAGTAQRALACARTLCCACAGPGHGLRAWRAWRRKGTGRGSRLGLSLQAGTVQRTASRACRLAGSAGPAPVHRVLRERKTSCRTCRW